MTASGPGEPEVPAPRWRLSPEQTEKLQSHLIEVWGPARPCPFHLETPTRWEIGNVMVATIRFDGRTLDLGPGPTYPTVPVTCSVCGFTVAINAITAGLVEKHPENGRREVSS